MSELVEPNALVAADTAPSEPTDLWTPAHMPVPSGAEGLGVATAWPTSVAVAASGAEHRVGRHGRPIRTLANAVISLDETDAARLAAWGQRNALAAMPVPLWADQRRLTADAAQDATELAVDTTLARYFAGARVLLARPNNRGFLDAFELVQIDDGGVASDALTLPTGQGVVSAWPAGSLVVPIVECDLALSSRRSDFGGNGKRRAAVQMVERVGLSQLPGLVGRGAAPTGWATHDGLPVVSRFLTPDPQSYAPGWARRGQSVALGEGVIPIPKGSRASWTGEVTVGTIDRAEAWAWLELIDGRRGTLLPFWWCPPEETLASATPTAGDTTTKLDVPANGSIRDWDGRSHVVLWLDVSGTRTPKIAEIDGVTRSAGVDTVTFSAAVSPDPNGRLLSAGVARKVRLASDATVEGWRSTERLELALELLEVPDEVNVAAAFTRPDASPLGLAFDPASCDVNCVALGGFTLPPENTWVLEQDVGSTYGSSIAPLVQIANQDGVPTFQAEQQWSGSEPDSVAIIQLRAGDTWHYKSNTDATLNGGFGGNDADYSSRLGASFTGLGTPAVVVAQFTVSEAAPDACGAAGKEPRLFFRASTRVATDDSIPGDWLPYDAAGSSGTSHRWAGPVRAFYTNPLTPRCPAAAVVEVVVNYSETSNEWETDFTTVEGPYVGTDSGVESSGSYVGPCAGGPQESYLKLIVNGGLP